MMSTDQKCCVNLLQPNKMFARSNEEYAKDASGCLQKARHSQCSSECTWFLLGFHLGVSGFPGALDQERQSPVEAFDKDC